MPTHIYVLLNVKINVNSIHALMDQSQYTQYQVVAVTVDADDDILTHQHVKKQCDVVGGKE